MKEKPVLSIAEKIKQIRKSKGLSIENLAHAAKVNMSTISRIENGTMQYSDEMLTAIVKYMEIENAPLAEHEIKTYKDRLWVINDLLIADRITEARAAFDNLFQATKLPYDNDLSLLYTMTEGRLLFKDGNMSALEEKVKAADAFLDGASNEALILYHRNNGVLCNAKGDNKSALKHYLSIANIESTLLPTDAGIYLSIGVLYWHLGKAHLATTYVEHAKILYDHGRAHVSGPMINDVLAACYQAMGQHDKAKYLLNKSLVAAKSVGNAITIGSVTCNLGYAYAIDGDVKTGLALNEEGLKYLKDHPEQHKQGLYNRAEILIMAKKYSDAKEAIALGKSLCKDDDMFAIGFEALGCVIALQSSQKDNDAADYINNVAIPYFNNNGSVTYWTIALGLCEALEAYYKKHRNTKMAMATAAAIRDIYAIMFIGDVE